MFKTIRSNIKDAFNQAVVHEPPAPAPVPAGWHEQVMAAIRRLGPLRKNSSMNDETTG